MTIAPSTLPRSAAAIRDDDGRELATIYASASGIEIVAEPGSTLDCTINYDTGSFRACVDRLTITIRQRHRPL